MGRAAPQPAIADATACPDAVQVPPAFWIATDGANSAVSAAAGGGVRCNGASARKSVVPSRPIQAGVGGAAVSLAPLMENVSETRSVPCHAQDRRRKLTLQQRGSLVR